MVSTAEIVTGILNFSPDEFFNPDPGILSSRESQLLGADYFGVGVNAPETVDTTIREKLPLIMAVRCSGDRDWDVRMPKNCFIAGTNMTDGTVRLAKAFAADEKEMRSRRGVVKEEEPRGPKPPGLALAMAQLIELDAKERLRMPWESGFWTFGIIYYDWSSNTVPVQFEGSQAITYPSGRSVFPGPNLEGGGASPCYLPLNKTPRLPGYGASFVHEQIPAPQKLIFNVYGSFSITMRAEFLPGEKIDHLYQGASPVYVAAIIPATFVLVGLDWNRPLQLDWGVPVYGASAELDEPVQGYFAIDINQNGEIEKLSPGVYFSYILMDGNIYGPQSFQIA